MQKALFILGQLNDDDVEWLAEAGQRHKYPEGGCLIEQSHANDYFFIILEGHVSISISGVGEVAVEGSGEILGEMSLVDSRLPSATVTALEDTYVLRISHNALRRQVESDLGFGMRFYRALATFLSERLRSQAFLDFNEEIGLVPDQEQKGELDINILDNLHVAGARFDRLLKRMMTARPD